MENNDDKKLDNFNRASSAPNYDEGNNSMEFDESVGIGNVEPPPEREPGTFERRPRYNTGGSRNSGGRNRNNRNAGGRNAGGRSSRNFNDGENAPNRYENNRRPRRYDNRGPERKNDFPKAERTEIKIKTYIAEGDDLDKLKAEALIHLNIQDPTILDFKVLEEGKRSFLLFGTKTGKYEFFVKAEFKPLARDFLTHIFRLAGLNLDLSVDLLTNDEEKLLKIDIIGEDEELLLKNDSELLASFDHCLRRYLGHLVPLEPGLKIQLSCNGSINSREEKIQQLTQKMKDRVIDQNAPVVLRPMNPTERRIVHQFLDKDESVRTVSLGDGHYKRIRIEPIN